MIFVLGYTVTKITVLKSVWIAVSVGKGRTFSSNEPQKGNLPETVFGIRYQTANKESVK